ncbi:hypothetical protein P5P86_05190 [Nocardioides sp. BP30]|uniref:hypothetical protein n=1 Tax=Nocardioides sp. BP30 TaxID=3036374 RepID=UPI0024694609|nr:hypothetical protein [Nocardioides sp. BP30]WGL53219.1 hypothetical protein P5P86_05190 [Nocardioides sp. BP30]
MSERVHFYAYGTGVSLELPAGFEQVEDGETTATYAELGDAAAVGPQTPALQIRVVGAVPEQDPDGAATVARLADQLAGSGILLGRTDRVVDQCPVTTVEIERDGSYLHLSAAAADGRLLTFAGRGNAAASFTVWDIAIESTRFITL